MQALYALHLKIEQGNPIGVLLMLSCHENGSRFSSFRMLLKYATFSRRFKGLIWILIALSFLFSSCLNVTNATNIVITFAAPKDEQTLYEPLITAFHQQHPEITVQFVVFDENNNSPASSGDAILLGSLPSNPQGQFLNLQPWLDSDTFFDNDDFWPGALDACQDHQGNTLGIPLTVALQGIFYEKASFDALNLPYPTAGWTWDDFRQTILELATSENGKIVYGFVDDSRFPLLPPLLDRILAEQDGLIVPEMLASELDWYVTFAQENKLYPIREAGAADWREQYAEWNSLFENGQAAMWVGPVNDSTVKSHGFVPFPSDGHTPHTSPAYATCAVISAGSQYPEAAWEWLEFLSQQPSMSRWEMGTLAARQSVADKSGFWQKLAPDRRDALRFSLAHAWYRPKHPDELGMVMTAISRAIHYPMSLITILEEGKSSIQSGSQPTLPVSTAIVQEPEPTQSSEQTTIRYFVSGARSQADLEQRMMVMSAEYEKKHPGVKIQYEFAFSTSEGDFWEEMAKTYDCFSWGPPDWGEIPTDSLLNLTSLVEAEDAAFIQDYAPFMLDTFRTDGGLYGLPAEGDVDVMAYNADLLTKRAIEIPFTDWAFDDFIRMATLASSKSEDDLSYGFLSLEYDLLLAGRGIQWPERTDSIAVEFDTPDAANTLAWLHDLEISGVMLPTQFIPPDFEMRRQAIQSGRVAFWTTTISSAGSEYFSAQDPAFQIGILPLPSTSSGEALLQPRVSQGHYISSQSKQIPLCWDWIKYLSQQIELFGGVPARKSVAFSPAWEAKMGNANLQIYQIALTQSAKGISPRPYRPTEMPLESWRIDVLQRVSQGEDIQRVLAQTQSEVDAYMGCLANLDLSDLSADKLFQRYVLPCLNDVRPDLARGFGFGQ